MGAGKSTNFEPAVFDKYTTPAYYLDKGSSGNVYGPIKWHGPKLAIKQSLFADGRVTDAIKKRIEEKKDIWTSLEHKNLMKIHWVDLTRLPKVMFIVMDFAAGGSLYKTLRSLGSGNKLPIDVVTDWTKQIADGMLYLHEKDIVHRNVKSSNILLMEPFDINNSHTTLTLKIAGFDDIKEYDQTATMSTFVGTCAYMAPEVIQDQRFFKTSDVWSFGVVIWEMLSGDIPHKGLDQRTIMAKSIDGTLDNLPLVQSFPEDYKRLLKRCWESTHEKRISFGDISILLQGIGSLWHEAPKQLQSTLISPSLIKQLRNNILQKMKSFRFPNVSITNCIFEDEYVEFYFVLEGISDTDESRFVSEIVTFLGVDPSFADRIKVTQLKSKPTGERTHFGPGNPIININARSMTSLGAFVSIGGKGDHVLSCGHDKKVGDILSNDNNERIGAIRAVACCVEDGQSYDAALANVDIINYTKSVAYEGRRLHLAPTPVDPFKGTVVQHFPPRPYYASQATIRHTDYNSFVHNIYGCFSVLTDNREDFHRPGESGLVVTSVPSEEFPEKVDPFGMLFFREFVEKTDDGRGYFLSLAIPMTKNLEKLEADEYCGREQITF